ncbi:VWA domain-containing protein [Roseibium aggregatum]|uniref:VWA domain-containing protein n=1 Tax=Roseibium aggregatum TaxID=187304 RepID=A0A939J2Y7_9HYPH|nr:VWA domain-containing protein [Roseibium aggregatum]MBN9670032.1 VWA domain-containing protein [Roseibium aggregatum]
MNDLLFALSELHFIRPVWLVLLPAVAALWFAVRRGAADTGLVEAGIAAHLHEALTVGSGGKRRLKAIDGVALGISLAAIGAAGPTWSRVPDPFVAQTVPMVVVLKVTPSMTANDVAPTRLERAKQKISDLLALRAGARTALVAYAGSAHLAVPLTNDPTVMQPYLEGLAPDVMPKEGANAAQALSKAREILSGDAANGAILFVLDSLDSTDLEALNAPGDSGSVLGTLVMLPAEATDPGIDGLGALKVRVTADNSDIRSLDRMLNADYRRNLNETGTQPWDDRGWLLAFPAALLTLIWFRRGWTMRWAAVLIVAGWSVSVPAPADAGVADWFFTPDQQGWLAYRDKNYKKAAELFTDPMWKARAQYRDGQYEQAAQTYDRLDTPEAAFAKGMAHIRSRGYREAIAAFEETLALDPEYPNAEDNLEIAREILDYVETAREQSDTGEDTGIGADDVVFDNKDARGQETTIEPETGGDQLLTADQWMKFVDTRTSDFLRQRFAIEAAQK